MHILFVTGEYPPMQGGVGAYTEALAVELTDMGLTVSVITSRQLTHHPQFSPSDEVIGSHIIPQSQEKPSNGIIRLYPKIERWTWQTCQTIAKMAKQVNADWIHVQYQTAAFGMNPSINFAPQLWHWTGKSNVAWTYHDLLIPYLFPKAGDGLRRWVTERPCHSAKATIVTNRADQQRLQQRGISPQVIPIGSNIKGYALTPGERSARRRMRGYDDDTLVLGYFGFLNRSKGGITLVRTLFRLQRERKQVRLLLIGERVGASDPTNYTYLQEVEQLIIDLDLADSVQWTGHQSDEEVGADLNACDVLLMPYEDGVSLRRGTLMAGLANGCAIVTTQPQEPIPELEDGEHIIYVPARDPDATALMVKHLADNVAIAERMRQNARIASQQFSWKSIAAKHAEIYRMDS